MYQKVLSLILSLIVAMTAFCGTVVSAEDLSTPVDEDVTVRYAYTTSVTSTISIASKTATCKSIVAGKSGITTKIVITQRLQKKNGTSWTNVQSWTKTFNQVSAVYTNTKSSLASGTYRTRTVAKVYDGTAYETVSANSTTSSC